MAWEIMAYDIAARLEQDDREDLLAEAADLAHAERATQVFADRIRAFTGRQVRLSLQARDWPTLVGELVTSGDNWLIVREPQAEHIVMLHAVTRLHAPQLAKEAPSGLPVSAGSMLRELHSTHVTLTCTDGKVAGRIEGVGKDYVVVNLADESNRRGSHAQDWQSRYDFGAYDDGESVAVPFNAIALISQAKVHKGL